MNTDIRPVGSDIKPPIKTKLQNLPIEELSWEEFEQLCLKIVELEFSICDCERKGKIGQNQQGIDIFAKSKDGDYSVYQCKKYKNFKTSDLNEAIFEFKKGKYFQKSKRLFICTSSELNSTQIQDAFEEHKALLKVENIELIKWDKIQISRLLKSYPHIVYDVFGEEYVRDFNGDDALKGIFIISESTINSSIRAASGDLYNIDNNFQNLPDSHILRKETEELHNWIFKELDVKESNIAILAGSAGTGKTVILKDLIDTLDNENIPVLGLKADRKQLNPHEPGKSIFDLNSDIYFIFEQLTLKHGIVVLLIDQIDALSQSLSTNREQIKAYNSLVNKLSSNKKIRIIISCRIFDLNHDMDLRQYSNKKIVQLSILSEEEVRSILFRLTKKNFKYPTDLLNLLRTPLHLDVFCRIFNESTSINEIRNLQDLYRNLWNLKVKEVNNKAKIDADILETVLYNIANEIYERQENLSVPVQLFDNFYEPIKYLKSENLIIENNSSLQFFHQSFYDYTYARNFVEKKGGDIFKFLINQKHQGLFIRSVTKQVLAYLRIYNYKRYIEQLWNIIFSDRIRYHIKLLIVESLSFEENPKPEEFKLVKSLVPFNKSLTRSFFYSIPGTSWFTFFFREKDILLDLVDNGDDQTRDIVSRFIVFSGEHNIKNSILLLNEIKDKNNKGNLIRWALFRTNDYSLPIVTNTYFTIENEFLKNDRDRLHIISNSIKSNPKFAVDEARKIFYKNLPDWNKKRKRELGTRSEESEFIDFCENLYKEVPHIAYSFIKEIVNSLVGKMIIDYPPYLERNILKEDFAFQEYNPDTYEYHKYLDWIIDYLCKNENADFVKKEIVEYLSSNQSTPIFIALQVLNHNPGTFLDVIFPIFQNKELLEDFLHIEDLRYWLRELINKTHLLFPEEKKKDLNNFFLSYYTKRDFIPDRGYRNERIKYGFYKNKFYPYPRWGWDQFLLLNSVPTEVLAIDRSLRDRLLMWNRRFNGWDYKNRKPNHHVTMASVMGGLVSKEKYELFTTKQWLLSFLKHPNTERQYSAKRYFSIEEHANAFRDSVKKNPLNYFSFISDLIIKNNVNIIYQIGGLEGLIEGEFDVKEIRALYSLIMERNFIESYQYKFIDLSKYFINKSFIDRELIDFWKEYIELPFENKGNGFILDSRSPDENNDRLFSEGWRSINAYAIRLFIQLSLSETYTEEVYNYLLEISDELPIQLRLVVLHSVDNGCGFNSEQLLKLFICLTKEVTSEVYTISPNLLNHLFSECFNDVLPFVLQTLFMHKAAKSLGIYLLYGWFYGHEKSKELLFELHKVHSISIGETIGQSFRYLHDPEYSEKCLIVLNYYSNDQRNDIRDSYSSGFYHLTPQELMLVKDIIKQFIIGKNEERLYGLYNYLFDCSKDYPKECIQFLSNTDFTKISKNKYEIEEPIKLIMLSYNAIRKYDSLDLDLDFAMDVFDQLLQQTNTKPEIDKILKDLDFD